MQPPKKKMIDSSDSKWTKLIPDLIRSVLERLSFAEFHTARSISTDWYSNAELCNRQNPTPWLILFSNKHVNTNISCKLFDPQGNKTYIVKDLGNDFHQSRCLASSGSWFLMLDNRINFYLLNLFTRERIRLPSIEAIDGRHMRFERVSDSEFSVIFYYESSGKTCSGRINQTRIGKAVLWVDERSRDYLVVWNLDCFFAYHKKGDDNNKSWKVFQPLKNQGCVDMVYKENKLYVLSLNRETTVYDFSCGDVPPKECASFPPLDDHQRPYVNNLVLTLSGEVLMIEDQMPVLNEFSVYKMDPTSTEWIEIYSIGNEALFLDLGTTVASKDGVEKNCIYSSTNHIGRSNIHVFDIQTGEVVQRFEDLAVFSSMSFQGVRWFFPTFGRKWLQ